MTEKEISKLTRKELIEMLLSVTRENDRLKDDVEKLNRELKARKIAVESSGTMAEAALKLNRVFEAADAAAKQYLQNVKAKADAEAAAEAHTSHEKHGSRKTHESHGSTVHKHDTGHGAEEKHEPDAHRAEKDLEIENTKSDEPAAPQVSHEPRLVLPEDPPKYDSSDNPFTVSEDSVEN